MSESEIKYKFIIELEIEREKKIYNVGFIELSSWEGTEEKYYK